MSSDEDKNIAANVQAAAIAAAIEAAKKSFVDTSSPYYVHPSDHPGLNVCAVLLKGDNYPEWELCFNNALHAKGEYEFIDGSLTKPEAAGEFRK